MTTPLTSLIERRLRAAGKPVAVCPVDGTVFDPHLSYGTGRTGAPRAYCSADCRRLAHREQAKARRDFTREHEALLTLHAEIERGQGVLDGIPPPPPPPVKTRLTPERIRLA